MYRFACNVWSRGDANKSLKLLFLCTEDPDPGDITSASGSSSESSKSDDTSELLNSGKSSKGLSRRQRKNRRREDLSPVEKTKQKNASVKKKPVPPVSKKKITTSKPLGQYLKFERMNATEKVFTELLHGYLLTYDQMIKFGYPVATSDQTVLIYKNGRKMHSKNRSSNTSICYGSSNADVKMTLPKVSYLKSEQYDSGHSSGSNTSSSSSESGEFLDSEESCSETSSDHDDENNNDSKIPPPGNNYFTRICCRCNSNFYTTLDEYLSQAETNTKCKYHWGKVQLLTSPEDPKLVGKMYTCCRGKPHTEGCTEAPVHVWDGLEAGVNVMNNFVFTKPRRTLPRDGHFGAYAIDCEMCYTVRGLELTKVTVVGMDGRLVYDSYVKPETEIVDYNTRFSGVSAKDLKRNTTKSLKEVQNDLMGFINAHTVLIGHGLENDLKALKLVHYRIVDTSLTFPHPNGLPYRWSLKNLALAILKRNIQCSKDGHESYEDACACMELTIWQVRKDYKNFLQHPHPLFLIK